MRGREIDQIEMWVIDKGEREGEEEGGREGGGRGEGGRKERGRAGIMSLEVRHSAYHCKPTCSVFVVGGGDDRDGRA